MSDGLQDFAFTDSGNEFVCTVERSRTPGGAGWWWFSVATDTRGQRYAPFQADPSDTQESVKRRIIEYYERMLIVRATPATSPWQQRRALRTTDKAAAAPTAEAEIEPTDAEIEPTDADIEASDADLGEVEAEASEE